MGVSEQGKWDLKHRRQSDGPCRALGALRGRTAGRRLPRT